MGDFIKIDRKILKWEWWSDINTSRLFIYMLISAYWKDGNYKGKIIPRGSFPSSISELAKETNLTENEIRTSLKHLKSTGEITSKSTNKFTVFSVKNYDLYQSDNKQDYKQITSKNTNKAQAINEQLTNSILKEDKNNKELKNEEEYIPPVSPKGEKAKKFIPPTVEEVDTYCREKNYVVDAQNFVDFYESKGWMVGKNKMKDWQAAVRTWERNRNPYSHTDKSKDINADRQSQLDYLLQSIREEEENDGS